MFQDLCAVPMMLVTPMLAGNAGFNFLPIALSLGKTLLLIGLVLLLAMFVVPKLLNVLVNIRVREILILGVVIICIGTAWLTSSLGLSLALGAFIAGLAISQVGEFAFVLAKFSLPFQILDANLYQGFLATAVLTMMVTPLLMAAAPPLAQRVPERLDSALAKEQQQASSGHFAAWRDHTIIVGFGLNGQYLARVLKDSSIPYCILELNPQTVREAQREDEPICFDDASRLEILRLVNFAEARILVITADDITIGRRIVSVARQNHPALHIIVRTQFAAHVEELYRRGANQVIAEEFETATEIFARVLAEYDLPRNAIDAYIETIRRESSPLMRRPQLLPASLERLRQLLAGSIVENFLILENSPAVGRTLAQLDLRNKTGATIIAIVRDNQSISNPAADFVLAQGDLLVVMGTHQELESVAELLEPNKQNSS